VLFSLGMDLVRPESAGEIARRVFQTFDPEGNNFIQAVLLEDVMRSLGLFADAE
jgi:Ca2+-binding EF-hand superfamily protein